MSFERPAKGVLSFQCDVCYDVRELAKSDGQPTHDVRECLRILTVEEGWSVTATGHLCEDCTAIAKSERERRV